MLPLASIVSLQSPTTLIALVLCVPILAALLGWRSIRKKKKAAENSKPKAGAFTIILMRGSSPMGRILVNCVFNNGEYVIDPKGKNPITVPFDGRFVKLNTEPNGQPFMHFDMESQHLVLFEGVCTNDDAVTVVHHDGVVEDLPADKAKLLPQSDEPVDGKDTVFRKHHALWKRWPGSRLFQEKTTSDWNNIQHQVPSWLGLLQLYGMPILIVLGLAILGFSIASAVK